MGTGGVARQKDGESHGSISQEGFIKLEEVLQIPQSLTIYDIIKANEIKYAKIWVNNPPKLRSDAYEHLVGIREFKLTGNKNNLKVGSNFVVTKTAPSLTTNWGGGDSYFWNPLLYAIDQERLEIVKLLMESTHNKVQQYAGLGLREFINDEEKYKNEDWKSDQK